MRDRLIIASACVLVGAWLTWVTVLVVTTRYQ